jgi:cell division protease FtsH
MKTKSEFEAELAVLLGGYTSEQLTFNELTTGASNDLRVASDLARRMVREFGMSEKLGPMTYGDNQEAAVFLGREMIHERNYSESVAQDIDREVRLIIEKALAAAKELLTANKDKVEAVAKELISKETLEQADFYALIGQPVPQAQA